MMNIMIEVPDYRRNCQCCYSDNHVKELAFRSEHQGVVVALCEDCRKLLLNVLTKDGEG